MALRVICDECGFGGEKAVCEKCGGLAYVIGDIPPRPDKPGAVPEVDGLVPPPPGGGGLKFDYREVLDNGRLTKRLGFLEARMVEVEKGLLKKMPVKDLKGLKSVKPSGESECRRCDPMVVEVGEEHDGAVVCIFKGGKAGKVYVSENLNIYEMVRHPRYANVKTPEELFSQCHEQAREMGWHSQSIHIGARLMLIVSEISEAMEGARKNLKDDHLPHRKMLEVELADAVIRIADLCGAERLDLYGAMVEKLEYNRSRRDHRGEVRAAEGGKKW